MKGNCISNDGYTYCDQKAECVVFGARQWHCKCSEGWAGNGLICGPDTDNDGWPDNQLNCTDYGCAKDNCINVTNADQHDLNRNGIGNACENMCDMQPCEPCKLKQSVNIRIGLKYMLQGKNCLHFEKKNRL